MMNISPQRGLPEIGPKSRRKERCSETISTVITISSIYRRCDSRVYVHDQVRTPPISTIFSATALKFPSTALIVPHHPTGPLLWRGGLGAVAAACSRGGGFVGRLGWL